MPFCCGDPRGNELHARRQRRLVVGRPGGADRPLADLNYPLDPAHFRRPAHGARQTPPLAVDLVAKIDVGVELQDGEASTALEGLKERDRHGIVAAEDDRRRAMIEDGRNSRPDSGPVAGSVGLIERQIAAIGDARAGRPEPRPPEIEIVMRRGRRIGRHRRANGRRSVGAIGSDAGIGRGAAGADDSAMRASSEARSEHAGRPRNVLVSRAPYIVPIVLSFGAIDCPFANVAPS
jgi:hypothetical protein